MKVMSNYVYLVKSKKGEPKDLWIMDAPEPKQATHIFSARFARYVKPKSPNIEEMFLREYAEELKKERKKHEKSM